MPDAKSAEAKPDRLTQVWSPATGASETDVYAGGTSVESWELGADPRSEPFVAFWLDRLTDSPRRLMDAYLSRAQAWETDLVPILASYSVPSEFLYLALMESGMYPEARSSADAVGIWQFTEETARQYGLLVEPYLDERHDERLATVAAGRYLRDLYKRFGSWELAAAAYNAGPGRVERVLARTGLTSYWDLIEVGHLPAETRAYVPRFLALVQLADARSDVRFSLQPDLLAAD
ncbi:MAG: lytic transglycosylase domain-containing protein [Longimicrobiales bacterium]